MRGEFRTSQQLVEQCLRLEGLTGQPGAESYDLLACSLMHQGIFDGALRTADEGNARFGAAERPAWVGTDGSNPGVACLYWGALSLWFLGRPAESLARMRASLRLAESFERPYLRISPETYAARLYHQRRDPEEVLRRANVVAALAPQHGYAYHEAMAEILAGWANAMLGRVEPGLEMVRRGLARHDASGAALDRPYCLAILAEVLCSGGDDAVDQFSIDASGRTLTVTFRLGHHENRRQGSATPAPRLALGAAPAGACDALTNGRRFSGGRFSNAMRLSKSGVVGGMALHRWMAASPGAACVRASLSASCTVCRARGWFPQPSPTSSGRSSRTISARRSSWS